MQCSAICFVSPIGAKNPVSPVLHQLRNPAGDRADRRYAAGHRFQGDQAEAFLLRREQQNVSHRNDMGDIILLAEEMHPVG
ncbi:hypothetical protein HMSSN139_26530 [Paenibacillus sp. HMSSN-139]|nr:hypothetical protein HMSSN139_26530 [Paenibacillus sp. HMSSN-139]